MDLRYLYLSQYILEKEFIIAAHVGKGHAYMNMHPPPPTAPKVDKLHTSHELHVHVYLRILYKFNFWNLFVFAKKLQRWRWLKLQKRANLAIATFALSAKLCNAHIWNVFALGKLYACKFVCSSRVIAERSLTFHRRPMLSYPIKLLEYISQNLYWKDKILTVTLFKLIHNLRRTTIHIL